MKPLGGALGALAFQFGLLSLVAFGGANAVVPEIQRQSVDVHHWMSNQDFAVLFALAQAAPGPNFMISTLVGWKVAGVPGALVATIAMCAPTCLLTYFVAKLWDRYQETRWRAVIAAGLAPITVGMVVSSGWLLARAADLQWRLVLVTLAAAAVAYSTRLNPLWPLAAAAALGFAGLLA